MSSERYRPTPEQTQRTTRKAQEEHERFSALPGDVQEYLGILDVVNRDDHGLPKEDFMMMKSRQLDLITAMDQEHIAQMIGFSTWRYEVIIKPQAESRQRNGRR